MGYRNLQQCVQDLETHKQLIRIDQDIDPYLEMGAIQRRVYAAGGPALLFTRVKGCDFPMLGNLFGTVERTRWIFRDTLETVEALVRLKLDPKSALKKPLQGLKAAKGTLDLIPRRRSEGPIQHRSVPLSKLPQLVSWPMDGGAFVTLPQVYTEDPTQPGVRRSNLGMYRVQISGNDYTPDQEAGLHYQIHRGIGVHHAEALKQGRPLPVNIFVGGPPSMTVAAVMPLPEGMPELAFAGLLAGHRIPLVKAANGLPMPAEADFVISGTIDLHQTKPEGPFGDHLGYYSLAHEFPVVKVDKVYHRPGAIWPFTTVGRPPQEDTSFGAFIHELTGDLIPEVLPGIQSVHAVDAAGVHPLLLAIGREGYVPYAAERTPQELLTLGNAVLGQGQLSLAKYLFIVAGEDNPDLDIHDIPAFFRHVLERADWRSDLHFQTATTIDTLDYSGHGLNRGSKVVIAAAGEKRRELPTEIPGDLTLPEGYTNPRVALPGVLAIQGPQASGKRGQTDKGLNAFCKALKADHPINTFPLIVLVDDSEFTARTLNNWLWVTFTRSDPAPDVGGIGATTRAKHWGCTGSLVIDARIKGHHAPPLVDVPEIEQKVDALAAPGGPLHGIY